MFKNLLILCLGLLMGQATQAQVASATQYGVVKIGSGLVMTNGVLSAPGGGGGSTIVPSQLRLFNAAWMSADPGSAVSNSAMVSGQAQLHEFYADRTMTITNVFYEVSTAGSGLTANGATIKNGWVLLEESGNYLAHADCSTDFTTVGMKRSDLNQSVNVTAGTKYYLLVISTGTTPVAMRVSDNLSGKSMTNAGRTSAPFIYSTKTTDGITSGNMSVTTGWAIKNTNRPWQGIGN